jgi:hypothetical protein
MRQAVVIIHGIGEQRPMETLRAFVVGALRVKDKTALDKFVFSKPDRIDDTLELRRLSAVTKEFVGKSPLEEECDTDFYEMYWQHLMLDTTWSSVLGWVFDLALRRTLPDRLRSVRTWTLGFLAAATAGIAALATGLHLYLDGSPLGQSLTILSASVLGVLGLFALKWFARDRAERFFLGYLGDAARYLTPLPANIKARRDIRTAGLALLRGLHDDELRRYDRIVLVGHSLGAVIAYDLITWFWQERHHRQEAERPDGKPEASAMDRVPEQGDDDGSPLKEQLETIPCSKEFLRSQWSLWQEMRRPDPRKQEKWEKGHRLPWRITDLVTLGSPLAHAEVLLAASKEVFKEGIRQREFPVCPPKDEDARDRGHLGRIFEDKDGPHYVRILHHGAPFAVTRWTNLYFPGDIIGGPVARLFGHGIRDVELCVAPRGWLDRLIPARSHTRYWDLTAGNASEKLYNALRLNDPSGQSDCTAKKRDASA